MNQRPLGPEPSVLPLNYPGAIIMELIFLFISKWAALAIELILDVATLEEQYTRKQKIAKIQIKNPALSTGSS